MREILYMTRIALISDIHFGKFSRTKEFSVPGEVLQDKSQGAVSLQDGLIKIFKEMCVNYLFIAGDLTSVASPQEFHYCEEKIIFIADEVGIPYNHILCCLGNHDVDRNITKICDSVIREETGEEVAKLIRQKYNLIAANCATTNLETLIMRGKDMGPAPYSGVYEEDKFIVFLLNSAWNCAHNQDFPHGKLSANQLKWFENVSDLFRDDLRIKFVLLHHHPFKYTYPIPSQDISELEEGSEFMDIVRKNKIDIIIHGHRHHPIAKTIQVDSGTNPVTLICAGSLSVNSEHRNGGDIPNTMHILELEENSRSYVLYNYKYTSSEGWVPLIFTNAAPLDHKMKLGKLFTIEQIEDAIRKIPMNGKEFVLWDDLDTCLQYITYNELNSRISQLLSNEYKIAGKFPDEVFLKKRSNL